MAELFLDRWSAVNFVNLLYLVAGGKILLSVDD